MTKYEKLTADLIAARDFAAMLADENDGGTCNLDSAAIALPRWNVKKTQEAFEKAGLRASKWKCFGNYYYLICGCYSGQGNRRTTMAEAVYEYLKKLGYQVSMYYQMD